MTKYNDYPLDQIAREVTKHLKAGLTFYQKFTCSHCGQRLTVEEKNRLFTEGTCDQCGKTTQITHCNYLLTGEIGAKPDPAISLNPQITDGQARL